MTKERLSITPLGGLGEIGLNCMVFNYASDMVVVDCGLMFPEDFHLGVDVVIPRFDYIVENRDRLKGIVLTHGHEDHIGALPWLVPQLENPSIYGSPFTLALVEHKLTERGLIDRVKLVPIGTNVSFLAHYACKAAKADRHQPELPGPARNPCAVAAASRHSWAVLQNGTQSFKFLAQRV